MTDTLLKHSGYAFLDISMQYFTFKLEEENKDFCTIAMPFSKHKYTKFLMRLEGSLDTAQAIMEYVLPVTDDTDVYIDDVGAFSKDENHHIILLTTILQRLWENGFTINH
jgi:hypothetical protein